MFDASGRGLSTGSEIATGKAKSTILEETKVIKHKVAMAALCMITCDILLSYHVSPSTLLEICLAFNRIYLCIFKDYVYYIYIYSLDDQCNIVD